MNGDTISLLNNYIYFTEETKFRYINIKRIYYSLPYYISAFVWVGCLILLFGDTQSNFE